jgi:hypothetical protein
MCISNKSWSILAILIVTALLLSGCNSISTHAIANKNQFKHQYIKTAKFNLTSYQKISSKPQATVNVYIEGDGRVLTNYGQVANDPSPKQATVMQLAALDPSPNVVYLARPCQYSPLDLEIICEPKYWTSARYSKEVVDSINQALNQIKSQSAAQKINLIGFSGGGALAVLVAANRDDIASIRTIAGNLNLKMMQDHHHADPLHDSLDPITVAAQVKNIPQIHFVGTNDKIVPAKVVESFGKRADLKPEQIHVLKGVSHHEGWQERWPELLEYIP